MDRVSSIAKSLALSDLQAAAPATPAPKPVGPTARLFEIRPADVSYTHPLFMQCFLPLRHTPQNAERWQVESGKSSMVILAGEMIDPDVKGKFVKHVVPAGPKARLILRYIMDYALRKKSPTIPIGDSLRQAMGLMGVKVSGQNGKELQRELENVASATFLFADWNSAGRLGKTATQDAGRFAKNISFWKDDANGQRSLWQSTMTLSPEFYEMIVKDVERMAPVYWPALIGLQHNARAMDIHSFLAFRLFRPLPRPVTISGADLQAMFGGGVQSRKDFWKEFKIALALAHSWYPTAKVELLSSVQGLRLKSSPALIPYRKLKRL